MPRAAPGEVVRGALHRSLPNAIPVPEWTKLRYVEMCSVRVGMEPQIHPQEHQLISSFTLHTPGSRVERGRLGEVESLVGDCRPPPPGNPRRPMHGLSRFTLPDRHFKYPLKLSGLFAFLPGGHKNGGDFLSIIRLCSFNNNKNHRNLKKLIKLQNFKKTCSYLPCADEMGVLRFGRSHSHPYGIRLVGSPPIVLTSVLKTKDDQYALSVL